MSDQTSRVSEVDVGAPPSGFQRWESTRVHFHGFEALTTTKGEEVTSPEFVSLGHRWSLGLFPGGDENSDDGKVALFLCNELDDRIELDFSFIVWDSADRKVFEMDFSRCEFAPAGDDGDCYGPGKFSQRSKLLSALVKGTLVVEVRMRYHDPSAPFIPKNPLGKSLKDCHNKEDSADVIFEVVAEQIKHTRKRAKTAPTIFYAHRFILQRSAPILAELSNPDKGADAVATISISGINPETFGNMLYYMYGGDIEERDLDANACKDLIDAADMYGVVHLKLVAEALYVRWTKLAVDNILDNLHYASCKNCALLKEAVMDFIVENGDDVVENVSFDDVPGSVVKDLLAAVNRGKKKNSDRSNGNKYKSMGVGVLRRLLDEKGLEVDGSREAIIARLKDNDIYNESEEGEGGSDDTVDA